MGVTLGQEVACGSSPTNESIIATSTKTNHNPPNGKRRESLETDPNNETNSGLLDRGYTYHDTYFERDIHRGGHTGLVMSAEDPSDDEDTCEVDYH